MSSISCQGGVSVLPPPPPPPLPPPLPPPPPPSTHQPLPNQPLSTPSTIALLHNQNPPWLMLHRNCSMLAPKEKCWNEYTKKNLKKPKQRGNLIVFGTCIVVAYFGFWNFLNVAMMLFECFTVRAY
ncbi:hypothetical protein Syun_019291 [Stephania yunnanensis]|uniref:Uncharacterized protein n=1 Tax=Stephania yunnanensis TaxID=152371 RepID=A0AAP0NX60_9MAGN